MLTGSHKSNPHNVNEEVLIVAWKVLQKQNFLKTGKPGLVGWPAPPEDKILWKTTTKLKVSFTKKKVLYLKENVTFPSNSCILKNVLY